MNELKFSPDPDEEPDADIRTFREELDRQVKKNGDKPFFFASTER